MGHAKTCFYFVSIELNLIVEVLNITKNNYHILTVITTVSRIADRWY